MTPETHFLAHASRWGLTETVGMPRDFETYWTAYTSWSRFRDLGIDAGRCRELIEETGEFSFKSIFRSVLATYREKQGAARVGEKTPGHSAFIPTILEWFPDARVLFTQRDPRAVIASQLKTYYVQERLTPRSLRQGLLTKKREQELIFFANVWVKNFTKRFPPWENDPRFYKVVYEDLVRDPDAQMRSIFDFLGEEFETAILAQRSDEFPAATNSRQDQMDAWKQEHIARSTAPVTSASIDKWKDDLTRAEIAMIEGRCGGIMRTLGYEPYLSSRARFSGRTAATVLEFAAATEKQGRKLASRGLQRGSGMRSGAKRALLKAAKIGIGKGLPPSWFAYRDVQRETVQEYFARQRSSGTAGEYETVQPQSRAQNSLPLNFSSRDQLPDDPGWWGYSFRDVPERISQETFVATVPDCLVTWYRDPDIGNDFYPAILNRDFRAFDMRELRFRPLHAATLSRSPKPARLKKATWFIERVYHNHSHWLTAHLPRLLLLRKMGHINQMLLPTERTDAIDGSLRMLGLKPEDFQTFDPARPLLVDELTILGTDRFRPELLRLVPEAFGVDKAPPPFRKVFISRLQATRRRLLNEEEVWKLLEPLGFQRVLMENLSFEEQVNLMRETAVLAAPHGAGLTNMMFCQEGAHVIEIADLGFPNPNFYALASALGHKYWLIPADSRGDAHPLEKDLYADVALVGEVLSQFQAYSVDQASTSSALD